jgi:hypothetical protein
MKSATNETDIVADVCATGSDTLRTDVTSTRASIAAESIGCGIVSG